MNRVSARARTAFVRDARAAACFAGPEAFEAYRRLYAPGSDVEATSRDVYASVESRIAGSLVISRRALRNVEHSRDAERVARDAFDHVTLGFVHRGELELQTARGRQNVRAGSVLLMDMTRPARYRARVEMTTVSAPRALVPGAVSSSGRLHGLQLSGAAAAPLSHWLDLHSHGVEAERALGAALARALQPAANDHEALASPAADRLDRARELIEARIADQALSPERLAKRLGMSRATLYRAFEPLGSVQRWRQGRRLLRLKAALAFTDAPVGDAAHSVGLENAAHASALFSKVYGLSPSQFRRRMAGGSDGVGGALDLAWIFDTLAIHTLRSQARASSPCR